MTIAGKRVDTRAFMLVFLGALSAFGPFVMDMYLPVLPSMGDWFGCSNARVQLGLTAGLIGLAAGQLVFGPVSDKYGRRLPLICAMVLFMVSTLGCIFSANIHQFIAMRLFQGLAGSGGVVLSRSIAADKYRGRELTSMMAVIAAVNGIATVAAPIAGGLIAEIGGWRGIFWSLMALSVLLLAGAVKMNECMIPRPRQDTAEGFRTVLRNRTYLRYVMLYMFSMGVLFTNIASAPFIMQEKFGLDSMQFSFVFGVNAMTFGIASVMIPLFRTREAAIRTGTAGLLFFSAAIAAAFALDVGFWTYEVLVFMLVLMVGIVSTTSNVAAMDSGRNNAGVASALLGAIGYAFGGVVPALVASGDMLVMTGIMFVLCSVLTASLAFSGLKHADGK